MSANAAAGAAVPHAPAEPSDAPPSLLRRTFRHPTAAIAAGVIALMIVVAIAAPLVAPYGNEETTTAGTFAGMTFAHPFGTDELGRDLLSRSIYGARIALGISLVATALAMAVGIAWGGVASLLGGWVDDVLMRLADTLMAIPVLLLALILAAALGTSVVDLVLILGVLHSPFVARVARAAMLTELHRDYCVAAVSVGASGRRIVAGEVLPNVVPVLVVQAAVTVASVILTEAALSFLGLGVQPPLASWGTLVQTGYQNIYQSISYVILPGLLIVALVCACNVLADRLQDSLAVD